jgi:hypothetical protein
VSVPHRNQAIRRTLSGWVAASFIQFIAFDAYKYIGLHRAYTPVERSGIEASQAHTLPSISGAKVALLQSKWYRDLTGGSRAGGVSSSDRARIRSTPKDLSANSNVIALFSSGKRKYRRGRAKESVVERNLSFELFLIEFHRLTAERRRSDTLMHRPTAISA